MATGRAAQRGIWIQTYGRRCPFSYDSPRWVLSDEESSIGSQNRWFPGQDIDGQWGNLNRAFSVHLQTHDPEPFGQPASVVINAQSLKSLWLVFACRHAPIGEPIGRPYGNFTSVPMSFRLGVHGSFYRDRFPRASGSSLNV